MCYHLSITAKKAQLEQRFEAEYPEAENGEDVYYHISGFAYPTIPVIRSDQPGYIQRNNWGLIPAWVKDEQQAGEMKAMTLNAKAETIFEKPSFKTSIKSNRCLVLINGFYEWKHVGKNKYPYFIHLKDKNPFALGGIYNDWVNKETGEIIKTFSIVTTEANPLMADIHNSKKRMPLILPKEQEKDWINANTTQTAITDLMKPFDENRMEAYTVSKIVSGRNVPTNVPEVLKAFHYPELNSDNGKLELF